MATANRRTERRREIVQHFVTNYQVTDVVDLTKHETRDRYLEGTGSVVFDHKNRHKTVGLDSTFSLFMIF